MYGEKGRLAVLYISKDKQRDENEKKSEDRKVEGDGRHGKDLRGVQIARVWLYVKLHIRTDQIKSELESDERRIVDLFLA